MSGDRGRFAERLRALGIELPAPMAPVATYVPYVASGGRVFVAGQGPAWNGEIRFRGRVGAELSLADAQEAARLTVLNLLAQLSAALGGELDRVQRCLALNCFVQAAPDFVALDAVLGAAASYIARILPDGGVPAGTVAGAAALPFDTPVELDAVFAVT